VDNFKWLLNLIVVVSESAMGGYKCNVWHTKATFLWYYWINRQLAGEIQRP